MKFLIKLLLVKTIILLLSSHSIADPWSHRIQSTLSEYNFPFEDGNVATLQGSCHKPDYRYRQMKGKNVNYRISIKEFSKKKIKVKGVLQIDSEKKLIKAPVIFYIPGAFSNVNISQTRRYLHDFSKMGYHVLVFPNPWGTDFIRRKVKKPLGDVYFEGQAMFKLLENSYEKLKELNITTGKARLMGVSYGGFVSSVVSSLNIESGNPLDLIDTTIVSPPLLLPKTLVNLDDKVEQNRDTIHLNLLSLYSRFKKICKMKNDYNISPKQLKRAEGLVIRGGFYDPLITSVGKYNKVNKLKLIPDFFFGLLSRRYKEWKKTFNFETYFHSFAPKNLNIIKSKFGSMYYWKERAIKAGYNNFRVLLAEDDFLNNPEDIIHSPDTLVLKDGGHYGFRHLDWYANFLKVSFNDGVLTN